MDILLFYFGNLVEVKDMVFIGYLENTSYQELKERILYVIRMTIKTITLLIIYIGVITPTTMQTSGIIREVGVGRYSPL